MLERRRQRTPSESVNGDKVVTDMTNYGSHLDDEVSRRLLRSEAHPRRFESRWNAGIDCDWNTSGPQAAEAGR